MTFMMNRGFNSDDSLSPDWHQDYVARSKAVTFYWTLWEKMIIYYQNKNIHLGKLHLKLMPAILWPFFQSLLQWRHNERDGVSNHQAHDCLLNRLFKAQIKETSNSVSLVLVRGIHWWPVNSLHKGSITRKMFLFDDVIMTMCKNGITRPTKMCLVAELIQDCYTVLPWWQEDCLWCMQHGSLARYIHLRLAHVPRMLGMFSPPPWANDPDTHHGTWCMPW